MALFQIPTAEKKEARQLAVDKIYNLMCTEKSNLHKNTLSLIDRAVLVYSVESKSEKWNARDVKEYYLKILGWSKKILNSPLKYFKKRRSNIDQQFDFFSVHRKLFPTVEKYVKGVREQLDNIEKFILDMNVKAGRNAKHNAVRKFISLIVEARKLNELDVSVTYNTENAPEELRGLYSGEAFNQYCKYLEVLDYELPNSTFGDLICDTVVNQK